MLYRSHVLPRCLKIIGFLNLEILASINRKTLKKELEIRITNEYLSFNYRHDGNKQIRYTMGEYVEEIRS